MSRYKTWLCTVAVILATGGCSKTPTSPRAAAEVRKRDVAWNEVGTNCIITGRLGLPLGTRCRAHCRIRVEESQHAKDCRKLILVIDKINDQKVAAPIVFVLDEKPEQPLDRDLELLVCEEGVITRPGPVPGLALDDHAGDDSDGQELRTTITILK